MKDPVTADVSPRHSSAAKSLVSLSGSGATHFAFGRIALTTALGWSLVASSLAQTPPSAPTEPAQEPTLPEASAGTVVLPKSVPDPIEPINRALWAFNTGVMSGIIKPTARAYRFIVIKPVRTGIGNFGRNITFPGRLINNLLQGKWAGARDETYRFACNSTIGIAGFLDLASQWKIPKADADFGQTFGQWGWKPRCYLMLPLFGPSNERDTFGLAADTAANPLSYLTPFPFTPSDPLTYISPYTYCAFGVMYNDLTDSVDEYLRFSKAEMDAYSVLQ